MFFVQIFIGLIVLAIALAIALIVASLTGLGWWGFGGAMAAQSLLIWLTSAAMKQRKRQGGIKGFIKKSWFWRSLLVLSSVWFSSVLLNQLTDAFGVLSTWDTFNFATTILGGLYLWWVQRHRNLNWVEFGVHCLMVLGVGVVLTYSSIPYEAVGDAFVVGAGDRTPYLLSLIGWIGPIKPVISSVLGSAQWFTTFLFSASTAVQVLSWSQLKTLRPGPERNALLLCAGLFYALELILAYREYPFILSGGKAIALKDLVQAYVGAMNGQWAAAEAIRFSAIAAFQCLSSVLALDLMLTYLLSGDQTSAEPRPRKAADPFKRTRRPRRGAKREVAEL